MMHKHNNSLPSSTSLEQNFISQIKAVNQIKKQTTFCGHKYLTFFFLLCVVAESIQSGLRAPGGREQVRQ